MAAVENPVNAKPPNLSTILSKITNVTESSSPSDSNTNSNPHSTSPIPSDAICRICRANHTEDKPLYHPCLCSGSIKFIHELCLSEWLKHSGANKCEVCNFEYKYNLDWGSREKNAKMLNMVRKRDFIYYFMKTVLTSTVQSLRIIFVLFLWFLVFVLNTLLVSPFLPNTLIDTLFFDPSLAESDKQSFLGNKIFVNGQFSFQSLFISVVLGGFAQIVLFIALCVFEFHHRHRDGVVADFAAGFAEPQMGNNNVNAPPVIHNNNAGNEAVIDEVESDEDENEAEMEENVEELIDNLEENEAVNEEQKRDENVGFNVLPPEEDRGFLNPDNIRDARPIELLGLGGRFNAFFSTIISVTVFNIALISTILWLPTFVGHTMVIFGDTFYAVLALLSDGIMYLYGVLYIQEIVAYLVNNVLAAIIPMMFDALDIIRAYFEIDYVFIQTLGSKMYAFVLVQKPLIISYVTSHTMVFGYVILIVCGLCALCLDLAYYYCIRPSLVQRRKHLKDLKSKQEIGSFWVFCEELSRIHTVFWRLIDSGLRVWDFAFQLIIVPYMFGCGIGYATQCIRTNNAQTQTSANSLLDLFETKDTDTEGKFIRVLEASLLEHMSYWIIGFWYIYASMKIFSQARHLMRIEFNACWMRFPQPNQIPISLSIARAMKERFISMRIHIPLIVMAIHIPSKIGLRLFPSVFPIHMYPLDLHKWPTAGMLFMISCVLAIILKRLRVQRRWNSVARYWLDTVCFGTGVSYLIVPGTEPNNDIMLEVTDANAQNLFLQNENEIKTEEIEQILPETENEEIKSEILAEIEKETVEIRTVPPNSLLFNDNGNGELKEEIKILKEKKEKLKEENESLKAKIKRLKKTKKKLVSTIKKGETKHNKVKQRRDDLFLKRHPWQNPNDIYLRLQSERNAYIERCKLYTIGITHLRLRIFVFVLCLWITHILMFLVIILMPLIVGRMIFNQYFLILLSEKSIENKDFVAYIIGLICCFIIPNEIHFVLSYHFQGTLHNNVQKLVIHFFIFVLIPLFIGYGWSCMIYHFLHSILLTPVFCVLELYCTGIYISIILLLFQNQNELQNILGWIQNNNNQNRVSLYRFFREFMFPVLRTLIYHISIPIALRFWIIYYINSDVDAIVANDSFNDKSTVIIDLNTISQNLNLKESDLDLIQKSVLKLQSILLNKVFLHYNTYELYLFLSCDVWYKLYEFVLIDYNLNIIRFLSQPFMIANNGILVTNLFVIKQFFVFVLKYLTLKCPIPTFAIIKLICIFVRKFVNHLPKIKDIILQERYFANRKLRNFDRTQEANQVQQNE